MMPLPRWIAPLLAGALSLLALAGAYRLAADAGAGRYVVVDAENGGSPVVADTRTGRVCLMQMGLEADQAVRYCVTPHTGEATVRRPAAPR